MSESEKLAIKHVAHMARLLAGEASRAKAIFDRDSDPGIYLYLDSIKAEAEWDMERLEAMAEDDFVRGSQGGKG